MRVPGLRRLKLSARRLRSRFVNGAVILGYHRISHRTSDPYSIGVTPEHFAEQMEAVRRYAYPMALSDLVQSLRDGNLPRRAVVVTFDDGYAETLHIAKPILESHDIPTTVFITTGYLGREFWWDTLERVLQSPERLPRELSLSIDGQRFDWLYDPNSHAKSIIRTNNTRHNLLLSVYQRLSPLRYEQQLAVIAQLQNWTGVTTNSPRTVLSKEEVLQLAACDLIEIGAHTVTHPSLGTMSPAHQRLEIVQSKKNLQELLAQPIKSFSYPHGSCSKPVIDLVRESGFSYACASLPDVARINCDFFKLPRFWVPDCQGNSFDTWLRGWISN